MRIYEILFENYQSDTILVNGQDRPAINSNGDLIADTRSGIIQFYNWFGNSVVVDKQGRPLVMYHGTNSSKPVKKFIPSYKRRPEKIHPNKPSTSLNDLFSKKIKQGASRTGYNKDQAGIFFTPSKSAASGYGMPSAYYLRIEHPLIANGEYTPFFSKGDVDVITSDLHKDGYIDRSGSGEYVVFDSRQIKTLNSKFSKKSSIVHK